MTIAVTRNFLLWCTVINYGVLLVWFLVFVFAHDWMFRIHGRWFRLSRDQFDALHYAGLRTTTQRRGVEEGPRGREAVSGHV